MAKRINALRLSTELAFWLRAQNIGRKHFLLHATTAFAVVLMILTYMMGRVSGNGLHIGPALSSALLGFNYTMSIIAAFLISSSLWRRGIRLTASRRLLSLIG